jgi:carboxypeptidase C (cathepsin A)
MLRFILISLLLFPFLIFSQQVNIPIDTLIKSSHSGTFNGKAVDYIAEIGNQPVWNDKGEPIATLNYTYYTSSKNDNEGKRPLLISFNGGPGSASAWMHVAYTGPKILNIDEEGFPIQPYGVKSNPNSILYVTDIIYVNPVNTGYSRTIPRAGKEVKRDHFFGINADVDYLAEWLQTFVSRHNRWKSPKFLIGESYGGTRVSGLAYALQNSEWMYLNGVIMVSPADYKVFNSDTPFLRPFIFPILLLQLGIINCLITKNNRKHWKSIYLR